MDEILEIIEKSEKAFNDMIDWHIAFFQEPDEKKQKLYHAVYESKKEAYDKLMNDLSKNYEK